jgi:ATP-dependent Lon protease
MQIDTDLFESDLITAEYILPSQLYIIPIRYRPIVPGIVTPLIISKGRFSEAVDKVLADTKTIGLVLIKDDNKDEIKADDLYNYGTAARILKKINLPDGGVNLLINSVKRFKINDVVSEKPYLISDVSYLEDMSFDRRNIEIKALTREILSQLKMLAENNPLFTEEMKLTMVNVDEPGKIADFVTSILNVEKNEYQEILENLNVKNRLRKVLFLLHKEMEVVTVQKKIQTHINEKIDKQQKEYYLREQMKAIKTELGLDEDDRSKEIADMKKKADDLQLKGEPKERLEEEIAKLTYMDSISSEYTVTKNYIDTILSLPWNKKSEDFIDLEKAEKILNRDHYGLNDVKKRIMEFLAVKKLKSDSKGSIICLVGPPGVGKTSLGKSVAEALGRKFFRVSLGGMRDEAEIKGHRKTYIGSMPGKIIQGLKIAKTKNPVFMLDEIDKLGVSFQGDPASALLEVLDPEQNIEFRDYYLDLPFDLSEVFFITTANTLDTIPEVLRDRMEIVRLSGYISQEKFEIAKRYLLPKQIKMHGLQKGSIKIDRKGFDQIINGWAREAGVRSLERQIEKICRKSAAIVASKKKLPDGNLPEKKISEYLGQEVYSDDELMNNLRAGVAIGLAWTSLGGAALVVESIFIASGKKGEGLKLTGQLGDVMSESANIAYSFIQNMLMNDGEMRKKFSENTLHLHVPAGATPKDGPSAGITLASSIYSIATGKVPVKGLAMTGELTLTGRVLPVGGIKEKIIAAKRAHLKQIIIPKENRKDMAEIPDYVKKGLKFYFVENIEEVIKIAFNLKVK